MTFDMSGGLHRKDDSMSALLTIGSTAIDTIETPTQRRENILGGSVPFFAFGAKFFTQVQILSPIGTDFPKEYIELFTKHGIDTRGLLVQDGLTFRWTGRYRKNMNDRDTLETQLNVLGSFDPVLPEVFRDTPYIFLANGAPDIQQNVLNQCRIPNLVVADTMDLWINIARESLEKVLQRVDGLLINDSEAILLTGDDSLVRSGRKILTMGPKFVVIKKGEHGALFFADNAIFAMPALPTENVVDPTGAGDSFGGGMMGYLASQNFKMSGRTLSSDEVETFKTAVAYGTVIASHTIEGFSLEPLAAITRQDVDHRLAQLRDILKF